MRYNMIADIKQVRIIKVIEFDHHNRNITFTLTLLVIALLGPIFHWAGLALRGISFFYISITRLVFAYLFLTASAAGAGYLILRPSARLVRLLAAVGLVLNIASVAYAGRLWSSEARLLTSDPVWAPFSEDKVGIVIAPAGDSTLALAEARVIQETFAHMLVDTGLEALVETRQITIVPNMAAARQIAQRMRAVVIIWGTSEGSELVHTEYHITSLGPRGIAASLDNHSTMLLLASIDTFSFSVNRLASENSVSPAVKEIIAPAALGFASIAANQPALAASYYHIAMTARNISAEMTQSLQGHYSLALQAVGRPDLARVSLDSVEPPIIAVPVFLAKGSLALALGDINSAEAEYLQARELDPASAQAYCGLAIVEAEKRNLSRARALAEQAAALEPKWGLLYLVQAYTMELQGDPSASLIAYDKAKMYIYPFDVLLGLIEERVLRLAIAPPSPVPTASVAPTPSPMPIPGQRYHTVVKGETIGTIARLYDVTEDAIANLNNLENRNVLYIGQVLLIPEQ